MTYVQTFKPYIFHFSHSSLKLKSHMLNTTQYTYVCMSIGASLINSVLINIYQNMSNILRQQYTPILHIILQYFVENKF